MAACNNYQGAEEVVQHLHELFGNTLNLDIIRNVADSCKFDIQQSSNQLLEITTNQNRSQPRLASTVNHLQINQVSSVQNGDKKSRKTNDIENAIKRINIGYKVLVILRGLPGSGKSTLAKSILKSTIGYDAEIAKQHILSTDDFFMKNGAYLYDANQISEAHGWNHQRAFNVMCKGYSPVIIDNTNAQMWEMKPYAIMATDYGYILEILEPDTHWCFNDKELTKRNTHGVPKFSIKNMMERYEKNVTPVKLLNAYDCKYKLQKPPQFRLYPSFNQEPPKPIEFNFNKPKPINTINFTPLNHTTSLQSFLVPGNKIPSIETINLMDFNEPDVPPTPSELTGNQNKNNAIKSKSQNNVTIDNMLMHDGGSLLKSTVLKPLQSAKIKQSASFFDNIQNAWGVDEMALRSWDIVTPLSEAKNNDIEVVEIDEDPVIERREASTSTDNEDFYILRNIPNHSPCDNVVILSTCNRDINRNVPVRPQGVAKKLMLDKSCLTADYFEDQNVHIEQLAHVFPNVPVNTLKYWYNKCNRDFECTIELLLAERDEVICTVIDDDTPETEPEPENAQDVFIIDSDSGSSSASETPKISSRNSKQKRKNNSSSDESNELKKCIESKVTIGDDHYSEKILKIKQQRFGPSCVSDVPQAGTSSALEPSPNKELSSGTDCCEFSPEFDGIDWEESCPEQNQIDDIETVEFNLGEHFAKQLEDMFGDPKLLYPKGYQPVVQMPVALARQLYTFYIESVYQQMDAQNSVMEALIKEDEEFARNLQETEEKAVQSAMQELHPEPTEIPDIMKEQKELNKWQKEADKWKELTPDTLAARLTKEKLFSIFPSLDKDALVEILHAHDNVYRDTVETLLASTNINDVRGHIDTIKDPPIDRSTISEMWEAHESCKTTDIDNEPRSAQDYREEASRFLKKRSDLYEKAQRFYQSGMTEVAQFYSGLASQQTRLFDKANSFAATAFLDGHSKRLQDFNTLDLHFLYVKEAIPSLDMFLDTQINLLRLSPTRHTEYLQIITGRGRNSHHGIAKIKPAVISRLQKRNISWQQLNPGLLKVKITKNSIDTSEL